MAMPSGLAATASRNCCIIFSLCPAREDVVDLRAGVGCGLPGAIVDDGAEGIALGAADEETEMDLAAPFVAQRVGVGALPRRERRAGQQQPVDPRRLRKSCFASSFPPSLAPALSPLL